MFNQYTTIYLMYMLLLSNQTSVVHRDKSTNIDFMWKQAKWPLAF